jgi:uncharacterized membrane protein
VDTIEPTAVDLLAREDAALAGLLAKMHEMSLGSVDARSEFGDLAKAMIRHAAAREAAVEDMTLALANCAPMAAVVERMDADLAAEHPALAELESLARGVTGMNLNLGQDFNGPLEQFEELIARQISWEMNEALPMIRTLLAEHPELGERLHSHRYLLRHAHAHPEPEIASWYERPALVGRLLNTVSRLRDLSVPEPLQPEHQLHARGPTEAGAARRGGVMYARATVGGHPLHAMLVGFPITFYVTTLVAFGVYAGTGHRFWLNAAIASAVMGAGSALAAALPGIIDLATGVPRDSDAKPIGILHGLCNVTALGLMIAAALTYAGNWNGPPADATLGLALSAAAVAVTLVAGILGATLVQRYHVGVRLSAAQAEGEPAIHHRAAAPIGRPRLHR